ncbi:hypothetical protein Mal15_49860 [Stieleria maiorica]|uniref:Uncharacterized protein n=1 Tax=Stieleria maiorica TaxID=2795974 RepID=A0A5B9MKC1_9BACT|nr:hypothetical protein Mal15_49860 [Stieleria maiorica]
MGSTKITPAWFPGRASGVWQEPHRQRVPRRSLGTRAGCGSLSLVPRLPPGDAISRRLRLTLSSRVWQEPQRQRVPRRSLGTRGGGAVYPSFPGSRLGTKFPGGSASRCRAACGRSHNGSAFQGGALERGQDGQFIPRSQAPAWGRNFPEAPPHVAEPRVAGATPAARSKAEPWNEGGRGSLSLVPRLPPGDAISRRLRLTLSSRVWQEPHRQRVPRRSLGTRARKLRLQFPAAAIFACDELIDLGHVGALQVLRIPLDPFAFTGAQG